MRPRLGTLLAVFVFMLLAILEAPHRDNWIVALAGAAIFAVIAVAESVGR